jgi:hypothetical protein
MYIAINEKHVATPRQQTLTSRKRPCGTSLPGKLSHHGHRTFQLHLLHDFANPSDV